MINYSYKLSETSSINLYLIRALAAQVVAIGHILDYIFPNNGEEITFFAGPAVPIFFFISGFLIAHSTFQKINSHKYIQYDFKQFFIKRFSRIYPLFLLVPLPWFMYLTLISNFKNLNILEFLYHLVLYISLLHPSLWTLNLFWWNYMFFGWLILGKRTVKKRYVYYLILAVVTFLLALAYFGCNPFFCTNLLLIWFLGVVFCFILNRINEENQDKSNYPTNLLDFRLLIVIFIFSGLLIWHIDWFYAGNIVIFFSPFLYSILLGIHIHENQLYQIFFVIPALFSGIFFIVYTQYKKINYPIRIKKLIKFMARYSFSLYLLHPIIYIILYLLGAYALKSFILFVLFYFSANVISILISYLVEKQSSKIYSFLLKKTK
jgi:peptidoglycan/LPS O-acetylase OafA/YrhL